MVGEMTCIWPTKHAGIALLRSFAIKTPGRAGLFLCQVGIRNYIAKSKTIRQGLEENHRFGYWTKYHM